MRSFKDLIPQGHEFSRISLFDEENKPGIVQVKMSWRIVSVVSPPISGTMASRRRLVFFGLIFLSEPGSVTRRTNGRRGRTMKRANERE